MYINFDEIKEAVGANEILLAQSVGSKFYGVNNPHDDDILIVVDKKNSKWRYYLNDADIFVVSREQYKDSLQENYEEKNYLRKLCSFMNHEAAKTYFKSSVYYGECEEKTINMYDNKSLIFERVLDYGDKNFFNPCIRNRRGNHGCSSMMSWALYYYYAFQNGSLELTSEQQNTIQLCHDGNLSIENAQELRKKIVTLLEK